MLHIHIYIHLLNIYIYMYIPTYIHVYIKHTYIYINTFVKVSPPHNSPSTMTTELTFPVFFPSYTLHRQARKICVLQALLRRHLQDTRPTNETEFRATCESDPNSRTKTHEHENTTESSQTKTHERELTNEIQCLALEEYDFSLVHIVSKVSAQTFYTVNLSGSGLEKF